MFEDDYDVRPQNMLVLPLRPAIRVSISGSPGVAINLSAA
jgi:hypothetical protein